MLDAPAPSGYTPPAALQDVAAWPVPLQSLPDAGDPAQLILLLHGWADHALNFQPLADALRAQFPQAAILAPQSPLPADSAKRGGQWYSITGIQEHSTWRERVQATVPLITRWVRLQQQRLGLGGAPTALGGFSQGAVLAMHSAVTTEGLCGRVLSFGARMVDHPPSVPHGTTFHLFHGGADKVFAAEQVRALLGHLSAIQADASLDVAEGVGHALHASLIQCAVQRLTNHIPLRTWQEAMGAAPRPARHD